MDVDRFDDVARALSTLPSRRSLLGVAISGVLGLAGSAEAKRRKRKHKKKKCKRCGACQTCRKGKCRPKADGAECGGPCRQCHGGACVVRTGEACGEGRICLDNGTCAQTCELDEECAIGCFCTSLVPETPPPFVCLEELGCANLPLTCSSIEPCPEGQVCSLANCNGLSKRCFPVCPN